MLGGLAVMPKIRPELILYGLGAAAVLLLLASLADGSLVKQAAKSAAAVPGEIVFGVGEAIGLPDTRTAESQTECERAKAAGDCWAASFACPALDYLECLNTKYL